MTTTIKLPIKFDDLLESIIFSGVMYTYSWYASHGVFPELGPAHLVGIYTDEEHTKSTTRLLDDRVLAEVIEGIIENHKPGWETVLHGALNDDFDANAGDIVLQYAVLGELVWG